jgi:hypothetical protein
MHSRYSCQGTITDRRNETRGKRITFSRQVSLHLRDLQHDLHTGRTLTEL